jgi:hypothetical protein
VDVQLSARDTLMTTAARLSSVGGGGTAVAPQTEPDVWFIYGWSNAVLPFIARTLQGLETQMAAVRAVSLAVPARPAIDEEHLTLGSQGWIRWTQRKPTSFHVTPAPSMPRL